MSVPSLAGATVKTPRWPPWQTLGIVAVGAIVLGLLVPQLVPGEMVIDKNHHKAEARADAKASFEPPTLADMPNPQGMLVRLLAGTVLVLGLAVASILGMRRWMQRQAPAGQGQRAMRLVETLPLGNRCCLHLVHLGKREILIGIDGAGVKTIVPLAKAFEEVLADTEPLAPAA